MFTELVNFKDPNTPTVVVGGTTFMENFSVLANFVPAESEFPLTFSFTAGSNGVQHGYFLEVVGTLIDNSNPDLTVQVLSWTSAPRISIGFQWPLANGEIPAFTEVEIPGIGTFDIGDAVSEFSEFDEEFWYRGASWTVMENPFTDDVNYVVNVS